MEELRMFSAGSANDESHTHLWVKGASLFISQLNSLIDTHRPEYTFSVVDINEFNSDNLELKMLFDICGSDKSNNHNYHILYSYIISQLGRDSNLNLLEIGLGTNNPKLVSSMGYHARPGASLFAFRAYLPNSSIYGADIDKDILFESERIKTTYVDQLDYTTFEGINTAFGNIKYDIIIDDGLHSIGANFNTLLFALGALKPKGWLIIEDIHILDNWKSIDYVLRGNPKYKTYMIKANNSGMYAVNLLTDS